MKFDSIKRLGFYLALFLMLSVSFFSPSFSDPVLIDASRIGQTGIVSNVEYDYLDGLLGNIQEQLNLKQDNNANLNSLSSPTPNSTVYVDQDNVVHFLANGVAGYCKKSGGPTSPPIWEACASGTVNGPGPGDPYYVALLDNTGNILSRAPCYVNPTDNVFVCPFGFGTIPQAGSTGSISLAEDPNNGSERAKIQASSSMPDNVTWTWPGGDNAGYLHSNGSGGLSFDSNLVIGSASGTSLSLSSWLSSELPVISNTSPSAQQAKGYVNVMTTTNTVSLPAGQTGMNTCIYVTTASTIYIDPNLSEIIFLDGVALPGGYRINNSPTVAGDFICLVYMSTGWRTMGKSGTWVNSGS